MLSKGLFEKAMNFIGFSITMCILCIGLVSCGNSTSQTQKQSQEQAKEQSKEQTKVNKTVVVYTSVDQVYSEPILKQFEKETGIQTLAVYDVEATKTVGLVNRLIAEKNKPQADLFWSGEFAQTILLKQNAILEAYKSPSSSELPAEFIDRDNTWTAFGGRARVLLYNKNLVKKEELPSTIKELVNAKYKPKTIGIASPIFGTTSTHAAALYAIMGDVEAGNFFKSVKSSGIQILDSNSAVKDMVISGKISMGMVDTDDALTAIKAGKPVDIKFLDQGENQMGTLVIPNTVALLKNGPHLEQGKQLADYLISKRIENELVKSGWIDIPSRVLETKSELTGGKTVNFMKIQFEDIYNKLEKSKKDLQELFVK